MKMKGITPNFGHGCIWVHRRAGCWLAFSVKRSRFKVTASEGITVDGSPTRSI